jgi:hypothetical protein
MTLAGGSGAAHNATVRTTNGTGQWSQARARVDAARAKVERQQAHLAGATTPEKKERQRAHLAGAQQALAQALAEQKGLD